jgi:hypothetical protein
VSALGLSASTIIFYALESCFDAVCPVKHVESAASPFMVLPAAVSDPLVRQYLMAALSKLSAKETAFTVYRCVLQSEVAAVSMVVASWCLALLALAIILAVAVPRPKPADIDLFRTGCCIYAAKSMIGCVHILAVSNHGYEEVSTILALWAVKFVSYQLHALLPLRSDAIRRAARINLGASFVIFSTAALLAAAHTIATHFLVLHARSLPTLIFFQLCAMPLHMLRFYHIAATEALHIADEVSNRHSSTSDACDIVPSFANERRAATRAAIAGLYHVFEGAALLVHHVAELMTFGFRLRIGDILLVHDIRLLAIQLLTALHSFIRGSLAHERICSAFNTAPPGMDRTDRDPSSWASLLMCISAIPRTTNLLMITLSSRPRRCIDLECQICETSNICLSIF